MNKILKLLALLLFNAFICKAYAESYRIEQSDLTVTVDSGSDYLDDFVVSKLHGVLKRQSYKLDKEQLSLYLIKDLYKTGFFNKVGVIITNNNEVKIAVVTNQVLDNLTIKGINKKEREKIIEMCDLKKTEPIIDTQVRECVFKINQKYKNSGFINNVIQYRIKKNNTNNFYASLIIDIKKKSTVKINSINIYGNKSFSSSLLKEQLFSAESNIFSFIMQKPSFYSKGISIYNQRLLSNFYKQKGFLNFTILYSETKKLQNNEVMLNYYILEGERFRVSNILVENYYNIHIPKLDIKAGDYLDQNIINKEQFRINNKILKHYKNYQVDFLYDIDSDNSAYIKLIVKKVNRQYINRIDILGNDKTYDATIRNYLDLEESMLFNPNSIEISKLNIVRSGIIKDIEFDIKNREDNTVDIAAHIKEDSTISANLYASYNGALFGNLSIEERNLLGTGKKMSFKSSLGMSEYNISLSLIEPKFFNKNFFGIMTSLYRDSTKAGADGSPVLFKKDGYNIIYKIGRNVDNLNSIALEIEHNKEKVQDLTMPNATYIAKTQNKAAVNYTYDTRNNAKYSTSGLLISNSYGMTLPGSHDNFNFDEITIAKFAKCRGELLVCKFKVSAAHIFSNNNKTGIEDRFFPNMRGFENNGIGSRTLDGKPLGGISFYIAQFQVDKPIEFARELNPRIALFLDIGNLFTKTSTVKFHKNDTLRMVVGAAFYIDTPFAQLGIEISKPTKMGKYDKPRSIKFVINNVF